MNPRLLLLEDDPVSAAFLGQSLAALPVAVLLAASLAQARRLAGPDQALWLFDLRLPDGDGAHLLAELRARGLRVPALALSAEVSPRLRRQLEAGGFSEVLAKPLRAADLQAAVQRHLPDRSERGPGAKGPATLGAAGHDPGLEGPAWDDAAALAALGGRRDSVQAMRQLFLRELPGQCRDLHEARARGDAAAMRELLHRLKASCGFVGAAALLVSVQALAADPQDRARLARLEAQARVLLGFSPGAAAPAPTAAPTN